MTDDDFGADTARTELTRVLRRHDDVETQIEAALDLGRRYLGVQNGHVARIDGDSGYWRAPVSTDPPDGEYPAGTILDLRETFCRKTFELDGSFTIYDAGEEGWEDDPAYEATGVSCYHGTAIRVDEDEYGTVCFISSDARAEPFSEDETLFAELVARRIEQVLERRRLRADADRLSEFVSVVSHDVRNPLNVAQARVEFALEGPDDATDHLDTAANALDRIEGIIDSSLTIARQGGEVDDRDRVSLERMAEGCWTTVETPDATLSVTGDCEFMADRDRLQHVFENLYRNAVEYAGADVTIRVGPLEDSPGFFVADDGPGIPEDEREEVFHAGYSNGSDHCGDGFGLAIVESVVDAHDWSVTVTDAKGDDGARFEVRDVVVRDE